MKIFQVINVRWYNATAWYAVELSRLLAEAGHEVLVLTQEGTPPERRAMDLGLHVQSVDLNTSNPARLAAATAHITKLLRSHRPDIVNCHRGEGFFIWGALKALGFPFKLVRTRGDQRLPKSDPLNRWLHASVADSVIVTNKRMASHFLNRMKTPEKQLWLIHGGIDSDRFSFDGEGRKRVRAEFGFTDETTVVGLLGRFDHVKGQRDLIRAVASLRDQGRKDIALLFIGADSATSGTEIEGWLRDTGIEGCTAISGWREDVSSCISALDLGVCASLWSEAIARSALEIMSCGVPLVSSRVGVMPDLVSENGLYHPGNITELASLIEQATRGPLRKTLRDAQERTISQLSNAEFLRRTETVYEGLLSG
ncbi:glycosyltransferase family 4 protein [Salidesulfovibrio brasiliensis]|uniref:glycosyltransferase family 4 protein n=1 Tax=Salidesulfovibrio brasiliensis TaxID=221711 RepID=UPI0006CFAB6A|nr:glycosyltransferase family 4 protein [Salidesulfovibrio brasiliensis]